MPTPALLWCVDVHHVNAPKEVLPTRDEAEARALARDLNASGEIGLKAKPRHWDLQRDGTPEDHADAFP